MDNDVVPRPRITYDFADGLRGLAALSVALFHATTFTGYVGDVGRDVPWASRFAEIGNYGVPMFIVLSGFVLMIYVANTENLRVRGGFFVYILRRAKRILPPYYAALLIFLALIFFVPILQVQSGTAWDSKIPVTAGGIISHVFLVHNMSKDWIFQIDGPAWSVATEWQIYFLFPLVLLPLWRKIGPWATVAVAIAGSFAAVHYIPRLGAGHWWFVGLFACGMLAAYLTVRGTKIRAGWPAIIIGAVALAWLWIDPDGAESRHAYSEMLAGIAASLMLLWLGSRSVAGQPTRLHRFLETRFLVWVGGWSFSLYLIHSPLLGLSNLLLLPLGLPTWLQLTIMWFVALPASAAVAYVFYRLVETHFQTNHQRAVHEDKEALVLVPRG
jgi:peptidoglycan/LPS O-acetylase OafA/YrhL